MQTSELQRALRKGSSNQTEREYLDFIISGQSLKSIPGMENPDYTTLIGLGANKEYENVF